MYICEFNFDFTQLLTIPGLLIIGGILLLLIALIIYIVSSRKASKEENVEEVNNVVVNNDLKVNENIESTENSTPQVNENIESVKNDTLPIEEVNTVSDVVNPIVEPVVDEPVNEPIKEEIVMPTPVMEPTIEKEEVEVAPVSEPVATNEEVSNPEPVVSIYGGVSPSVSVVEESTSKGIYGGADPLENTQTIPTIEPKKEYGVPVSEPVVEKEEAFSIPTPVFETINNENVISNEATLVDEDNETIVEGNVFETKKEEKKDEDIEVLDF